MSKKKKNKNNKNKRNISNNNRNQMNGINRNVQVNSTCTENQKTTVAAMSNNNSSMSRQKVVRAKSANTINPFTKIKNSDFYKKLFKKNSIFLKDGKSMLALAGICTVIVLLPIIIFLENKSLVNAQVPNVSENELAATSVSANWSVSGNVNYDELVAMGPFYSVGALSDTEIGDISNYMAASLSFSSGITLTEDVVSDNMIEEEDSYEYENLAIANVTDFVNVREEPNTDSAIIGKIYNGAVAHVISKAGDNSDWFYIESGSVTGYIKSEYFISGEEAADVAENYVHTYVTVLCDTLNVREEASTDSKRIGFVKADEELMVLEEIDGWYKVQYSEDKEGYVSSDYVSANEEFSYALTLEEDEEILLAAKERDDRVKDETAQVVEENLTYVNISTPPAQLYTSNAELRQAIIDYAMQYLGNRYVSGGSTLAGGTDCSGFTSLVYADFGYSLSRIPQGQYTSNGRSISYEEAQPGDIVCYSANGSSCTHVALYIGNGQILHSSTPSKGVIIANISSCGTILAIKNVID